MLAYAALSYHLPLLIAFSIQQETQFVWGGFMLLPLQEMLADQHGIMEVCEKDLRFTMYEMQV